MNDKLANLKAVLGEIVELLEGDPDDALRNAAPELLTVVRAAREMRAADMYADDADEYVESRVAFDRALDALDAKLGEVVHGGSSG